MASIAAHKAAIYWLPAIAVYLISRTLGAFDAARANHAARKRRNTGRVRNANRQPPKHRR